MSVAVGSLPEGGATQRSRGPTFRFLFVHQLEEYPSPRRRTGYLAVAVLATIVLYYTYYTQTGVTPNILQYYHMSFGFYVGIVIVSNLIGAFASLPASQTDRLGRSNVVIYGLLIVGLLVALGVPNVTTEWGFAVVICAIGLVEGAILVATPALVRDFSPQMGRASAMGFWTVGPVAGSLVTSIVANHTLSHFVDWQSQFIISGITAIVTFGIALFFLKDLSSRIRDQLMVNARDRTLVEARARGVSVEEVEAATVHPWRQILKWDLAGSSFGIAVFLLVYYVAAAFFTIYYSVTFKNPDGSYFSVSQVNGLNTWFWAVDIGALIVAGFLSDRTKVRKPFMLIGALLSIVMLIVFLSLATHPYVGYWTLVGVSAGLAIGLSLAYAPWMAGYTETVEAKNPALVGTGLALWGWILRLVVGISFIFLPLVITSVTTVVDNEHLATPAVQAFTVQHPKSVAFAESHQTLLTAVAKLPESVQNGLVTLQPSAVAYAETHLTKSQFTELSGLATQFKTLVVPYKAQLTYLSDHEQQLTALNKAVAQSPNQWQHWFWIDLAGMVVFIPLIFLTRGRWSPGRARRDEQEHEQRVADELAKLAEAEGLTSA